MASSYLNLYNTATSLRQRGMFGSSTPYNPSGYGWGGSPGSNVYVAGGEANKVVHDTLNNKYYGTQKQSDLIKGLTDSIKRTQDKLSSTGENRYSNGWMGALNSSYYRYTAEDRKTQNELIKSQQNYLDQINNGMYKQESSTFFDSYDDWTSDWDNLFARRKSNADQEIENAQTVKQNERNKRMSDRSERENIQLYQGDATKSKAKSLGISPNTDINTGMSTEATKLSKALLKDNGLSI